MRELALIRQRRQPRKTLIPNYSFIKYLLEKCSHLFRKSLGGGPKAEAKDGGQGDKFAYKEAVGAD